ncbi:MAG: hypothetical protein NTY36_13620 [Deltaproteobacteria bacterium]|nr:hypothetical protein [Deltaproteobacteria bacterium]
MPESIWPLAWKAQLSLCARYRLTLARGKAKQIIVTATPGNSPPLSGPSAKLWIR